MLSERASGALWYLRGPSRRRISTNPNDLWHRYQRELIADEALGVSLDLSRMDIDPAWRASMEPSLARAFDAMEALERGAVANPDEGRMVGHYWLRDPSRAPDAALRGAIEATVKAVETFADDVHAGRVAAPGGARFRSVLVVGIGGSALGPQFVRTRSAARAIGAACTSSTTPTPTASTTRSSKWALSQRRSRW